MQVAVIPNMKIGRNDRCHCGSGLKYKKCHMNKPREIGVLRKAYDMGKDHDFYTRFLFGLGDIRSCAYGRDKQLEYDKSFSPVFQINYPDASIGVVD